MPEGQALHFPPGAIKTEPVVQVQELEGPCAGELTDGEEMAPALLSFIFLFPVLIIWSAFKPHTVKPELCEQPDLLTKAMSNIIAQYSYKLNY